jgi:hypothetical protein
VRGTRLDQVVTKRRFVSFVHHPDSSGSRSNMWCSKSGERRDTVGVQTTARRMIQERCITTRQAPAARSRRMKQAARNTAAKHATHDDETSEPS